MRHDSPVPQILRHNLSRRDGTDLPIHDAHAEEKARCEPLTHTLTLVPSMGISEEQPNDKTAGTHAPDVSLRE